MSCCHKNLKNVIYKVPAYCSAIKCGTTSTFLKVKGQTVPVGLEMVRYRMSSTSGKRCQSAVRTLGRSQSHDFQILDARFSDKDLWHYYSVNNEFIIFRTVILCESVNVYVEQMS